MMLSAVTAIEAMILVRDGYLMWSGSQAILKLVFFPDESVGYLIGGVCVQVVTRSWCYVVGVVSGGSEWLNWRNLGFCLFFLFFPAGLLQWLCCYLQLQLLKLWYLEGGYSSVFAQGFQKKRKRLSPMLLIRRSGDSQTEVFISWSVVYFIWGACVTVVTWSWCYVICMVSDAITSVSEWVLGLSFLLVCFSGFVFWIYSYLKVWSVEG